jgi:hypothetical protein
VVEPEPIVEEVLIEDIQPIEEEVSVEVETETIILAETPIIETATPTIKKETYNTYKKKKHKYR